MELVVFIPIIVWLTSTNFIDQHTCGNVSGGPRKVAQLLVGHNFKMYATIPQNHTQHFLNIF